MDLHKETHTAVLVNCWNEILRTIEIANKPSEFTKLTKAVNKTAATIGLQPIYGLENAYGHGRALAVWLFFMISLETLYEGNVSNTSHIAHQ